MTEVREPGVASMIFVFQLELEWLVLDAKLNFFGLLTLLPST